MDSPLVSIITPVLNGIKYLESCIQSVINQTYINIEHVFADGGSTDGTVEMLANYKIEYPDRFSFISEPDTGAGDAWNKGLRMARGDIFGWLGADDMLSTSETVQTVIEFFKSNPDAYFVYGGCNYINENGEIISTYFSKHFDTEELINERNRIPATSAFYKRAVLDKVGWFDSYGNDLDYWIRVSKSFEIFVLGKVLSSFRIHSESETGCKKTHRRALRKDCLVSRKHGGRFFSGYRKRYFTFLIVESLRPFLGFLYPYIKHVIRKR